MRTPSLPRILIAALLLPLAVHAQWEITKLGVRGRNTQGVTLAPAIDVDAVGLRLYAASGWGGDGKGYEWTCTSPGGAWSEREVYSGLGVCYSPIVAALKDDGRKCLYVASYTNRTAYETAFSGGLWTTAPVAGSTIDRIVCVRVAAGRNDGVARLFLSHVDAGAQGGLYEFSWNVATQTWDKLKIHGRDVGEFAVADGRNDGTLRIYAGARLGGDGGLIEFTWDGARYAPTVLSFADILRAGIQTTYVGDGRGDARSRVYVNEWGQRLLELTYDNGTWRYVQVAAGATRFYVTSGRVRADNQRRVYASVKGSGVYEYTWTGTRFEATVDAVTSATGQLAIGNGRNDGRNRLYVGHGDGSPFDGSIAEISDPDAPPSDPSAFRRGDANADGTIDLSDPIATLLVLFRGRPLACKDAADANDDGAVDIADAVRTLDYLFRHQLPPPPPFSQCGGDPTADALTCDVPTPCP